MPTWVVSNAYLGQADKDNNALCAWNAMGSIGWSRNATAAVLGNFDKESTLNPGIWQNLDEWNTSLGLGLGQWTPATKLLNWASGKGIKWDDGDNQCQFLTENSGQWHTTGNPAAPNPSPLLSWEEFMKSELDVETLTNYFYYWWEDPSYSDTSLPPRRDAAKHYFSLIGGVTPSPPGKKSNFKWWVYQKRRWL